MNNKKQDQGKKQEHGHDHDDSHEAIGKDQYKEHIQKEKRKLMGQVIIMTVVAGLISVAFFVTLISSNPHGK